MASNRIGRINEEIQRELSTLIRSVKDPRVTGMISVTAVETTPDLRFAKVYVSMLDKSSASEVVKGLKSAAGYLRRLRSEPDWRRSLAAAGQETILSRYSPRRCGEAMRERLGELGLL